MTIYHRIFTLKFTREEDLLINVVHYVYHEPRKGLCCLIFYFFCIFVFAFSMFCLIMIQVICFFLNVGIDLSISVFSLFLQTLKMWLSVMEYCLQVYFKYCLICINLQYSLHSSSMKVLK